MVAPGLAVIIELAWALVTLSTAILLTWGLRRRRRRGGGGGPDGGPWAPSPDPDLAAPPAPDPPSRRRFPADSPRRRSTGLPPSRSSWPTDPRPPSTSPPPQRWCAASVWRMSAPASASAPLAVVGTASTRCASASGSRGRTAARFAPGRSSIAAMAPERMQSWRRVGWRS